MNLDYNNVYLNFSFGFNKKLFFNNAQCTFKSDSINFLVGQNGIGKSTLLRILQGEINNDECIRGDIIINSMRYNLENSDTQKMLNKLSRLVVQNYNNMLALDFTVDQNLAISKLPKFSLFSFSNKDVKYAPLLYDVGINLTHEVSELSGGQKQILAIIMSLQKKVNLLFLDEPTAALDDKNSKMVMDFLTKLIHEHRIIVICISHDKELISKYSNSYFEIVKNQNNERSIKKKLSNN